MFAALTNMKRFRDDPLAFTEYLEATQGEIAKVALGPKTFHFVYDADAAEHVLLTHAARYQKSRLIFDKIIPITGKNGLVQLEGDTWAVWRARTGEMFTKHAFSFYPDVITHYLRDAIKEINHAASTNTSIDISALFVAYTIRTAVAIFLGCDDKQVSAQIAQDFIELNYLCGERMRTFVTLPLFIKTKQNRKITTLTNRLRTTFASLIHNAWINNRAHSLIDHLITTCPARNETAIGAITDQLMTFLFAGFETTSSSLTFCFYLLARHPLVQNLVRQEIIGLGQEQVVTRETMKRYGYAIAVYKEALRMFPPAWILAREALVDDNIDGHHIRKRDTIIVCIRQIHRNKTLWADAEDYQPERFLTDPSVRQKKCAFMPFGVGPRICSGNHLAILEAVSAIATLCPQFEFVVDNRNEMPLKAFVTLNPKSAVLLKVKRL